ncbi:MAG: nucleoside-diphosphate kinase [Candidatus Omnitrophota bacterium]|nr:nucleoside-diphosphate kinase [Candidatus Omnitrophota bacterium]MBU2529365.1 nucleoside-diphosphate kinase [bacterium]MBU3930323.1 nucleoside-diphosphate kinase [bacterium]MBU4122057.1 nucleoside-diphosphate kinase [bacterium]
MEKTLFIIKPDAVCEAHTGKIIDIVLKEGFMIRAVKMTRFSWAKASKFYAEHKGKAFYGPLIKFMTSNPVIAIVLERENAVKKLREIVGKTNPAEAARGTIRKKYARDGRHNAVHASDSLSSAKREIPFFFKASEIKDWKYIDYPVIK